ncbi:MAG: hypothetical protein GC136_08735 [Alphaproteobacteria bacterium]|nr:hypothetical protein [Alphaproteobacteria bacterium]
MNVSVAPYDGGYAIVSDAEFPADVKRIEYYKDQKLFIFVYENGEDELVHYELHPQIAEKVEKLSNIAVQVVAPSVEPYWYTVPLIQIGV